MSVGVVEFNDILHKRNVPWELQSRSERMSTSAAIQAGLTTGKDGIVGESRVGWGNITAVQSWNVVCGDVTLGTEWLVSGYECTPDHAGLTVLTDAFISGAESLLIRENDRKQIVGVWGIPLSDMWVNFPGAEEPVKRWQGNNLTPVVYF
ncbi:TPA: hypothetical protein ACGSP1_004940 [Escherichia coli]